MAHANPSGYHQSNRQYPSQHQHYSHSTTQQQSYFSPHYALSQRNAPAPLAPGYAQKKYPMAQTGISYRPPMGPIYTPSSSGVDDSSSISRGSLVSTSTPSLSSFQYSSPITSRHRQHSRSFSYTSVSQASMTSQPSLIVAPAPDRYHRRKSMGSLTPASFQETPFHKHSTSESSITPPSNASSTSTSTSSSSAMSNQTYSTPLSSASSVPSSPVLSEPRFLKQATRKDSQEVISTSRKSKPFIAASVSPAPSLPPPLVLPSEVRRHSITTMQQSRSASISPPRANTGISTANNKSSAQTPTRDFHTPLNSNRHVPMKVNTSHSSNNSAQPPRPNRNERTTVHTRASVSRAPGPTPPMTPEKLSFGQKLRKAFSFSRKKQPDRAATMSGSIKPPSFGRSQPSKSRTMTLTSTNPNASKRHPMTSSPSMSDFSGFSSVLEGPPLPSPRSHGDSASIKSAASSSSLSKFKRVGNRFNKGAMSFFSGNTPASKQAAVGDPGVSPTAAGKAPIGRAAPAEISHVVAEAEYTAGVGLTTNPVFDSEPKDDKGVEKSTSESESDEDLNAADTVFPKNLDSLAVETIRSSLERTKSLERRRSRRSARSVKSTDSGKRKSAVIPNALEVHLSPSTASISDPDKTKQHTPPHGILKELNNNESNAQSESSLAAASRLDPEVRKYKSSLKRPNSSDSIPLSVSPHPELMPRAYSSNSIAPRRTSRTGGMGSSGIPGATIISNPGSMVKFSSRIVIYDTYDCTDYDRRAEISTCNRLNPTLARQIREELNSFKMEMEVHESSRAFTHFY